MKPMDVDLQADYALGTTTMCKCLKVTRLDGVIVGVTDHVTTFDFGGVTYLASAGFSVSDIENSSDMSPDNLEIEGFLADPLVTEEDIYSGRWDNAAFELFEVNFRDLANGRNWIKAGNFGEVRAKTKGAFTIELRGLMQRYSRRIIELTSKECLAEFGDARCGIDLALWTESATVDTVPEQYLQFTDPAHTEEADYWKGGTATFTSGDNSAAGDAGTNLSMEIKSSTSAGLIALYQAMPFPIGVGDTVTLVRGCQKRLEADCRDTYDNVVNFRGVGSLLPGSRIYARPQR
jgi:uncharacterized phage protein (TIGR02218 family)